MSHKYTFSTYKVYICLNQVRYLDLIARNRIFFIYGTLNTEDEVEEYIVVITEYFHLLYISTSKAPRMQNIFCVYCVVTLYNKFAQAHIFYYIFFVGGSCEK